MKQRNFKESPFTIKPTGFKGCGLFATKEIQCGELIIEYVGEMIRSSDTSQRIQKYRKEGRRDNYLLEVREHYANVTIHTCIDATMYGNESRFINHSCDPNCSIEIVLIINVSFYI